MRVIPPHEIGESIIALLNDAHEFAVLVSPYNKLTGWMSLKDALDHARQRSVDLHYFVRDESDQVEAIRELGIEPIPVPRLHAKLYVNETRAVFGSMNIHASSDAESLELAVMTESVEEYQEIWRYYSRYLAPHRKRDVPPEKLEDAVCLRLAQRFPERRVSWWNHRDGVRFQVGRRNFDLTIETRSGENWALVRGILPSVLGEYLVGREGLLQRRSRTDVRIVPGGPGFYGTFEHRFRAPDGDPARWSRREIEDTAAFIAAFTGAVFSEIANSADRKIASEL